MSTHEPPLDLETIRAFGPHRAYAHDVRVDTGAPPEKYVPTTMAPPAPTSTARASRGSSMKSGFSFEAAGSAAAQREDRNSRTRTQRHRLVIK